MMHIARNERTAWRRIENEVLIISSDTNKLTILNDTGARVWELLEQPQPIDHLVHKIASEFEVTVDDAQRDVCSFIDDLTQRGLLQVSAKV